MNLIILQDVATAILCLIVGVIGGFMICAWLLTKVEVDARDCNNCPNRYERCKVDLYVAKVRDERHIVWQYVDHDQRTFIGKLDKLISLLLAVVAPKRVAIRYRNTKRAKRILIYAVIAILFSITLVTVFTVDVKNW